MVEAHARIFFDCHTQQPDQCGRKTIITSAAPRTARAIAVLVATYFINVLTGWRNFFLDQVHELGGEIGLANGSAGPVAIPRCRDFSFRTLGRYLQGASIQRSLRVGRMTSRSIWEPSDMQQSSGRPSARMEFMLSGDWRYE